MFANPVSEHEQFGSVGVVSGRIAEQHGLAITPQQRFGYRTCDVIHHVYNAGWRNAFFTRNCSSDGRERLAPLAGRNQRGMQNRNCPIRRNGVHSTHFAAMTSGLANPLSEQRMILAQVGTHHQHML